MKFPVFLSVLSICLWIETNAQKTALVQMYFPLTVQNMEITDENGKKFETESGINDPWNFGILTGISVKENLYVNTGLVLLQKGFWKYPVSTQIGYLELPVRLEYDLKIYKGISILGVAGLYGACGLWAGTYDLSEVNTEIIDAYSFGNGPNDFVKRFDLGFSTGLALQWLKWGENMPEKELDLTGKGFGIRINVLWSQSLIDLTPNEQGGTTKHKDLYIHFAVILAFRE